MSGEKMESEETKTQLRKVLAFKPRSDMTMGEFTQILTALTVVIDAQVATRLDKKLLRHFEEKEI